MRANPKPLLAPLFPQCEGICCFPWFHISVMTKEHGHPSLQGHSELHLGSSVPHLADLENLAEDTPCGAPGRPNRRAVHSSGSVLQCPCTGFAQEEEEEAETFAKEMQLEEFQALEVKGQSENLKDNFNPEHWVHLPSQQHNADGRVVYAIGVGKVVKYIYGIQWKKCIKK